MSDAFWWAALAVLALYAVATFIAVMYAVGHIRRRLREIKDDDDDKRGAA